MSFIEVYSERAGTMISFPANYANGESHAESFGESSWMQHGWNNYSPQWMQHGWNNYSYNPS